MNSNNLNLFFLIGFALLAMICGYFVYQFTHDPEVIEKKVSLTNFEKQQLIQHARLGWISKDSLNLLLKNIAGVPAKKINWIDSIKWNYKDSTITHLKDSTVKIQYPVYEADSSFEILKEDSIQNVSVNVKASLKQRFLPLQEAFASEFNIDSLIIKWHEKKYSFWKHIKYGPGISVDIDGKIKPTISVIYSF